MARAHNNRDYRTGRRRKLNLERAPVNCAEIARWLDAAVISGSDTSLAAKVD
jgi:hypothetical protein